MLLMVEKGIRGGIYYAIHRYSKANNKYMKDYDENNENSYRNCQDVHSLYGQEVSQKLPADSFKLVENTSQLTENYSGAINDRCFLEVYLQYP